MKKTYLIIAVCFVLGMSSLNAQDDYSSDYNVKDFQFTFLFPPLTTNGTAFAYTVNKTSLNLFMGISAGTDGFEAAGFLNINKAFVKGAQFAGFLNVVGGEGNYTSSGFQLAGFGNVVATDYEGAVISGFINVNGAKAKGAFASGFANIAKESDGANQFAGFLNTVTKGETHIQLSGWGNIAQDIKYAQVSGFGNIAKNVNGFQGAGFINVAKKVRGVQLAGFLNVADTIDGVPIAFISIVKKGGYHRFEASSSDFAYVQMSFKMGIRKFYNIYTISKLQGSSHRWAIGGGFGTEMDLTKSTLLNLEATVHQELWINDPRTQYFMEIDRTNLVVQLKAAFGKQLSERASMYIAPTLNIGVSSDNQDYDYYPSSQNLGKDIQPYWNVNPINGSHKTRVRIWPGFSAGIRI